MEKVYLKPMAGEIVARSASFPGHADTFSYDAHDRQDTRRLGSLFVVGHAQQSNEDVAYMVNLVASLAKREYFANPHLESKEAFTNTLKKINEVVQDFFKNKGLELNLGVFAVAGEQIYISKLGKFKIFLAREDKVIDVLNNVDLFEKELTEEKEFSNIISGKISANDKILAFNPAKAISSREKTIKTNFASLSQADFTEKIQQLKAKNESFGCAMLHIDMKQVREAAEEPKAKLATIAPIIPSEQPQVHVVSAIKSIEEKKAEPVVISGDPVLTEEPPRIIPTEFSLGRRGNPVSAFFKKFHFNFRLNARFNRRTIMAVLIGVVAIGAGWGIKSVVSSYFGNSTVRTALKSAKDNIKTAQAKIDSHDVGGARSVLVGAIASIKSVSGSDSVQKDLFGLLDKIDQVQEASPTLVYQPTVKSDPATLMTASGSAIFSYTSGMLNKIENGSLSKSYAVTGAKPTILTMGSTSPVLLDLAGSTMSFIKDGAIITQPVGIPTGAKSAYLYQGNLYVLGAGIYKTTNAVKTSSKPAAWLKSDSSVPADSLRLLVDGNIFVVTKSGVIVNYYKGAKVSEVPTGLTLDDNSIALTTPDSVSLYLINTSLNRVYIVDKKLGTLTKTYKIDSQQSISSAAIDGDESIYFSTQDGKIWKISTLVH